MLSKTKVNASFYWLIHPAALALYVLIILVFSLPEYFDKYNLIIHDITKLNTKGKIYYHDLNNDGESEILKLGYNNLTNKNGIHIQYFNQKHEVYNQWNVKGDFLRFHGLYFSDYDHNKFSEVFLLTTKGDSIFLNGKELMNSRPFQIQNRFICNAGIFSDNKTDVAEYRGKFLDIDQDGYLDFIFALAGGFSKYPRNVFVYYIHQDSLVKSPPSASIYHNDLKFFDLNNDGIEEITGTIGSPENIHYPMPYTDSSCWMMVINPVEMNFLFPPIRYDLGMSSMIVPEPVLFKGDLYILLTTLPKSANQDRSQTLQILNTKGIVLNSKTIPKNKDFIFINPNSKRETQDLFLADINGNIYKTDTSLNLRLYYDGAKQSNDIFFDYFNYKHYDLESDGGEEVVFIGNDKLNRNYLKVYNSDLNYATQIELPHIDRYSKWYINCIQSNGDKSQNFLLVIGEYSFIMSYHSNPYYYLKYPIYFLVFLVLTVLFWLLQKAQKSMVSKRYETEKQLMQQQMALSKKQMEPHFMLNMINNIGYMFSRENKQDALFYLGKFGNIMRRGLLNAQASQITLEEELEFVQDYLILQKKLMDDELDYILKVDEMIEEEKIQLPHSLIYTFVENALKHGLKPKANNRKLEVRVDPVQEKTKITIHDNGIGRKKSKDLNTTDTGKGMEIINSIIQGYNQLHDGEISYNVEDILDDNGDTVGTLVEVWV